MQLRSTPTLNKLGPLFRGADQAAYSLPGEVVRLRAALATLSSVSAGEPAVSPAEVEAGLVDETVAAAVAGAALPDVEAALAARRAAQRPGSLVGFGGRRRRTWLIS